jgi:SAM-dependent methyltransferase
MGVSEMNCNSRRPCPICGGQAGSIAFPYGTRFNNVSFDYLKCDSCASVFVDPVPDQRTFELMYAKSAYHDLYYADSERSHYTASAKLLREFLPANAVVLDYGCGLGAFLKALEAEMFKAVGVEFDEDAAKFAAKNSGCKTFSTEKFEAANEKSAYDAVHLGDVLEHLPDPAETLRRLLAYLKPGGLLFAEGPLENNPSPVYWAARTFGAVKRRLNPDFVGLAPPTHLLRVDADRQLAFFTWVEPRLQLVRWDIHETGWPYANGGTLKQIIAGTAFLLGGKRLVGATFGNRFRGVFRLPSESDLPRHLL